LLDAEQLLREPDFAGRYHAVLLRLVPHLEIDLVTAQLGAALGLDPQVLKRLLDTAKVNLRSARAVLTDSDFLRSSPKGLIRRPGVDTQSWVAKDQFAALELLGKIATIANRLAIRPEQWAWVSGRSFSVMDVLALPTGATNPTSFDGWRKLMDRSHLRDVLPDGPARPEAAPAGALLTGSLGGYLGLRYAATRRCSGWIGLDGPFGVVYPWEQDDPGLPESVVQIGREIRAIDVAGNFAAMNCPALLLLCSMAASPVEECLVSARRALAEHVARHHSNVRIEWIPTGHDLIVFHQPQEAAARMRDFLIACRVQRNAEPSAAENGGRMPASESSTSQ
jgi:hypothetical protein